MSNLQRLAQAVTGVVQSEEFDRFRLNARDFLSAKDRGESANTQIAQMTASLEEAAEILNRSFARQDKGVHTNVISPVVIPKDTRSFLWMGWVILGFLVGGLGLVFTTAVDNLTGFTNSAIILFGPHYWVLLIAYALFSLWHNSFIMVPDGCQALITRFGKLEMKVGAGRTSLFDPWKKVSYIVNTTKEYPYNAPIREAPTASRIDASVDLFLQFKIEDPEAFIFTLGGVNGFSEKLHNAISEVTRALIYEQKAETIYDLVGESTQSVLDGLNSQFLPAVRFVNANITHAEPSSQEYRMDLAAAEVVRVAKEAYSYEYELRLRKEQDEGELNKELGARHEELSEIRAEIARYQAQIDTAREKEINRANAYAQQLMIEAESEARANAALLEAQALDIRAISSAYYPEILEHRHQQEVLERIRAVSDKLPQIIHVGADGENHINFMTIARQMLGIQEEKLYTEEQLQAIRERIKEIMARIKERAAQLNKLSEENGVEVELG